MIMQTPGIYLSNKGTPPPPYRQSGIATFAGITARGPHHSPQRIESWEDFTTVFGGIIDYGYLPSCVFSFFGNGGEICFIIRVLQEPQPIEPGIPAAVQDQLARARTTMPVTDHNSSTCLAFEAINYGAWGNDLSITIIGDNHTDMEITHLRDSVTATATQIPVRSVLDFYPGYHATIVSLENTFIRRVVHVLSIDKTNRTITLSSPVGIAFTKGSAVFGTGFSVGVQYGSINESFVNLSMNPDHPRYIKTVINGTDQYIDRKIKGNSILVSVDVPRDIMGQPFFKPQSGQFSFSGGGDGFVHARALMTDSGFNTVLRIFSRQRGRAGDGLRIETIPCATKLSFDSGLSDQLVLDEVGFLSLHDVIVISPGVSGETRTILFIDYDTHRITINSGTTVNFPMGTEIRVADRFNLFVYRSSERLPLESFFNLSMDTTDTVHFIESIVNTESQLIVTQRMSGTLPQDSVTLSGGRDPGEIAATYYTGYKPDGTLFTSPFAGFAESFGIAADKDNYLPDCVAIPDLIRSPVNFSTERIAQWQTVIQFATLTGDRIISIDPDKDIDFEEIVFLAKALAKSPQAKFAVLYYPLLTVMTSEGQQMVPPSGSMAGLMRRVDSTEGIGRAPANFLIKGIVSPERDIDTFDQAELNRFGINCIRSVNPGYIHILGARTLSTDPRYRYAHVRRVMNDLVKTLQRELLWAVFEPAGPALQKKIRTTLITKLNGMVRKGLTATGIPQNDFYVRCNESINTEDLSSLGIVLAEIGLALSNPAEFIEIVLQRTPEAITLTESDI